MSLAALLPIYAVPPEPADETDDWPPTTPYIDMVDDDQIARSKSIQQQTGKTFHLATRLLPERVREATYVLYAFFRVADEVVDDADGVAPDEQRAELEAIRAAALGERATDDPVLAAFSNSARSTTSTTRISRSSSTRWSPISTPTSTPPTTS